jgi:hypothetical protein
VAARREARDCWILGEETPARPTPSARNDRDQPLSPALLLLISCGRVAQSAVACRSLAKQEAKARIADPPVGPAFMSRQASRRPGSRTCTARLAGSGSGFTTSTTVGAAAKTRLPREAGNRRVCPAVRICASLRLSVSGLPSVPSFHEDAPLLVDGRGVAEAEGGAGCAAGDEQGASRFGQDTSRGVKAARPTGPRRRVRVPAPEEKQGVRAHRDDGGRAAVVARPGGGETHGSSGPPSGARASGPSPGTNTGASGIGCWDTPHA